MRSLTLSAQIQNTQAEKKKKEKKMEITTKLAKHLLNMDIPVCRNEAATWKDYHSSWPLSPSTAFLDDTFMLGVYHSDPIWVQFSIYLYFFEKRDFFCNNIKNNSTTDSKT